jgi:methylphosphotriester-DNA--protein-cysteine methyltransferase
MQSVSEEFDLDASNLTRRFRNVVGVTPKHFLDKERKRFVLEKLLKRTMLGYEIGAALGFPDDISFYRWVRRAFGRPLREMQNEQ